MAEENMKDQYGYSGRVDLCSPKLKQISVLAEKILNPEISYSPDVVYAQMRIIQQNVDCAKEIIKITEGK